MTGIGDHHRATAWCHFYITRAMQPVLACSVHDDAVEFTHDGSARVRHYDATVPGIGNDDTSILE